MLLEYYFLRYFVTLRHKHWEIIALIRVISQLHFQTHRLIGKLWIIIFFAPYMIKLILFSC